MLLIEAGPDYPDFERLPDEVKYGFATATDIITKDHNWEFMGKATDTAPPMRVPRGRVTGGSSAINGQMFLRAFRKTTMPGPPWATTCGTSRPCFPTFV